MARSRKPTVRKPEPEEFDNSMDLAVLTMAYDVAKLVFKTEKPTPEMVFGVHDNMDLDSATAEDAAADFTDALATTRELFHLAVEEAVEPATLFGVFGRACMDYDDEGEE